MLLQESSGKLFTLPIDLRNSLKQLNKREGSSAKRMGHKGAQIVAYRGGWKRLGDWVGRRG